MVPHLYTTVLEPNRICASAQRIRYPWRWAEAVESSPKHAPGKISGRLIRWIHTREGASVHMAQR